MRLNKNKKGERNKLKTLQTIAEERELKGQKEEKKTEEEQRAEKEKKLNEKKSASSQTLETTEIKQKYSLSI